MATASRYKLKLTSLKFLSAVDRPAQSEIANAVLLKRAGAVDEITLTATVAKVDETLGLVFGWAFASSLDGGKTPYADLQGDEIDDDFVKVAMDFMLGGAATDVMHDGEQDGRIAFALPITKEIGAALGIKSDTVGLAVAIKPSPDVFAKFKSGELKGFSIAGTGERTEKSIAKDSDVPDDGDDSTKMMSCPACGADAKKGGVCKDCGYSMKRDFSADQRRADAKSGVAMGDGSFPIANASDLANACQDYGRAGSKAAVAAHIKSRAAALGLTNKLPTDGPLAEALGTAKHAPHTENSTMEKLAKFRSVIACMATAHLAAFAKMSEADQDALIEKSPTERATEIEKSIVVDPVIYKAADGTEYHKSEEKLAKAVERADKADAAAQQAAFEKSADAVIGKFPGDVQVRAWIMKSLATAPAPSEDMRSKAMDSMRGANGTYALLEKHVGHSGGAGVIGGTALDAYNAGHAEFAKAAGKKPGACVDEFHADPKGAALYKAYREEMTGRSN